MAELIKENTSQYSIEVESLEYVCDIVDFFGKDIIAYSVAGNQYLGKVDFTFQTTLNIIDVQQILNDADIDLSLLKHNW